MTRTAARIVALPFALAALGLRLVDEFWIQPLTWRVGSWQPALAIWLLSAAASIGLPLGGYLLLTRQARRRPASWSIPDDGPRFTAGVSPRLIGPWVVALGWASAGGLVTEREFGTDRMHLVEYGLFDWVVTTLVLLGLAVAMLVLLLDRPRIVVDREAVTVRRVGRRVRLGWEELLPGGPPPPDRRNLEKLVVYRVRTRGPRPVRLPAGRLHVDPAFLAHTIRRYTEHPEDRAAIGTPAGLAELQASFAPAQGRPAPGSTP